MTSSVPVPLPGSGYDRGFTASPRVAPGNLAASSAALSPESGVNAAM
ncbi:hypothetical protein ACWFR1_13320 [Streptomyces sp. NPDC055103]